MTHKQWLDNEYSLWVKALQESTVHNFKEHPMVKRMLGEPEIYFGDKLDKVTLEQDLLNSTIDSIGRHNEGAGQTNLSHRYVYYAQQILKRNPSSICEIGGGVGQLYAILRALGYKGEYWIMDQVDVESFQYEYLNEVAKQTGLNTDQSLGKPPDMVVSFYALGEFDDARKGFYFEAVIPKCKHGYIAWNPHSGASDDLTLFKHDIKVTPGIEPGIKIIEW